MNMERTLGKNVERFDQKDGPGLGERQAKTYGARTRLTAPGTDSRQREKLKEERRTLLIVDLQSGKQS